MPTMSAEEIKVHLPMERLASYYGEILDVKGQGRCLQHHKHRNGDIHPS
jgi:hypothetical protein